MTTFERALLYVAGVLAILWLLGCPHLHMFH